MEAARISSCSHPSHFNRRMGVPSSRAASLVEPPSWANAQAVEELHFFQPADQHEQPGEEQDAPAVHPGDGFAALVVAQGDQRQAGGEDGRGGSVNRQPGGLDERQVEARIARG